MANVDVFAPCHATDFFPVSVNSQMISRMRGPLAQRAAELVGR